MTSQPGSDELEAWRTESLRRERVEGWVICALPAMCQPPWIGFDILLEPTLWRAYMVPRVVGMGINLASGIGISRARSLEAVRGWTYLSYAATSISVAVLVPLSSYYATYVLGYSLIIWGLGSLAGQPLRRSALFQGTALGAALLAHAVLGGSSGLPEVVGAHFYLATAAAICVITSAVRHRTYRTAFTARWKLAHAEAALREAKQGLEVEVQARTLALQESLLRLEQENAERMLAEARAEEGSRAKSTFLANMSHELRTPLNAILGYTEMVQEELEDPDMVQDLDQVNIAARHLLQIIDDVLDLSRAEAGQMACSDEVVDLGSAIHEAVELIRPQASQRGNTVTTQINASASTARGDPVRIRQVIVNLLSNAVKFTEGGTITVTARSTDADICEVVVADTGIGIPEEELGTIFDRFHQADAAPTRRAGGTGLGLSICHELVHAMLGTIEVHSVVGEGTHFVVKLPRAG